VGTPGRSLRLVAGLAVLLIGPLTSCVRGRAYRDSWRPEESAGAAAASPRVLGAAVLLGGNVDVDVMRRAGATLIGWHDINRGWALRAGSTGGTHFLPVEVLPVVRPECYRWGDTPLCWAGKKPRLWVRIAVFRLEPDRWHTLPAHLIPTDVDLIRTTASAVRTGCRGGHLHYGTVRCNRGWRVVTNAAVAASTPPVAPQPVAGEPGGPAPSGPDEPTLDLEGASLDL
jgi:hypothetical protein